MIEQQGRVLRQQDGKVTVALSRVSGCPACEAGKGCGAGVFGRLTQRKPMELELDGPGASPGGPGAGLRTGQAVVVGIPETLFLGLLARLYLLPLLAGIAGAAAGHYLAFSLSLPAWAQDLSALCGALILAALTLHFQSAGKYPPVKGSPVQLLDIQATVAGADGAPFCQSGRD